MTHVRWRYAIEGPIDKESRVHSQISADLPRDCEPCQTHSGHWFAARPLGLVRQACMKHRHVFDTWSAQNKGKRQREKRWPVTHHVLVISPAPEQRLEPSLPPDAMRRHERDDVAMLMSSRCDACWRTRTVQNSAAEGGGPPPGGASMLRLEWQAANSLLRCRRRWSGNAPPSRAAKPEKDPPCSCESSRTELSRTNRTELQTTSRSRVVCHLCVGVAERIDLPSAPRDRAVPEVLLQELVAAGGLVDHLRVERAGLIVHAPAYQQPRRS